MLIKEQISSELEFAPPEILDQVYEFILLVKMSLNYRQLPNNKHFLFNFAGCFDEESAREIRYCISTEFQNIEGEW